MNSLFPLLCQNHHILLSQSQKKFFKSTFKVVIHKHLQSTYYVPLRMLCTVIFDGSLNFHKSSEQ